MAVFSRFPAAFFSVFGTFSNRFWCVFRSRENSSQRFFLKLAWWTKHHWAAVVATAEVAKAGARKGVTGRVAAARAEAVQVMVPAAVMGSCAWQAGALRSALGL